MPVRKTNVEESFGTDSFLDVVSNLVGILIILIVVAGLRVAHAPVSLKSLKHPSDSTSPPPLLSITSADSDTEEESESPAPIVPEPPTSPPEPIPELVTISPDDSSLDTGIVWPNFDAPNPIPSILAELDRDRRETRQQLSLLATLKSQLGDLQSDLVQSTSSTTDQTTKLTQLRTTNEKLAADILAETEWLRTQQSDVESQHVKLSDLQRQIDEAAKPAQPKFALRHKLTPVARRVSGREIHFRLDKDRVAFVPVEALAARVQEQIEKKRSWLAQSRVSEGAAGPVDGFRMIYVVEREQMSLSDELKHGPGMIKFVVSRWRIEPSPDVATESPQEALQQGSRFQRALQSAPVGTTLTFWVSPDSFALHRALIDFAHERGFDVAARPVPAGIPIVGSRSGSRSEAQ